MIIRARTPDGMIFDNEIGYSFAPKSSPYGVTLNDIGCIGDDVIHAKAADETRVLLLGGSTSFSSYYVDSMRTALAQQYPLSKVKVVSCGRPRYKGIPT